MKITDVRTATGEANYARKLTRIYPDEDVTGFGESFLICGLAQGEIRYGC